MEQAFDAPTVSRRRRYQNGQEANQVLFKSPEYSSNVLHIWGRKGWGETARPWANKVVTVISARTVEFGRNRWAGRQRDVFGDNTECASQGLNDVMTVAPEENGLGERTSYEETNTPSAWRRKRRNDVARNHGDRGRIGTPSIDGQRKAKKTSAVWRRKGAGLPVYSHVCETFEGTDARVCSDVIEASRDEHARSSP